MRRPRLPRAVGTAWKDMRHRRGQSILSAVSLLVGILAVVAIYTASSIVRDVFVAEEERIHGRAVTVEATMAPAAPAVRQALVARLGRRLTPAAATYAVLAQSTADVTTAGAPDSTATTMQAVWCDGDLRAVKRLPMRGGRWFRGSAMTFPPEIVVNESAWQAGGLVPGSRVRLGSTLARSGMSAVVVGVVADGRDEQVLYSSLRTVVALAPELVAQTPLTVLAHLEGAEPGALVEAVSLAVRDAGGDLLDQPRRADRVAELERMLGQVQLAFLACAAIALLISALGILNIGLAGVRERSRELLVRRAVGARRADLVTLVLLAALFVAVAATVVGVAVAVFVVEVVVPATVTDGTVLVSPRFPWQAAAAGAAAAVLTALVGAAVPAVVASRVQIADALRV